MPPRRATASAKHAEKVAATEPAPAIIKPDRELFDGVSELLRPASAGNFASTAGRMVGDLLLVALSAFIVATFVTGLLFSMSTDSERLDISQMLAWNAKVFWAVVNFLRFILARPQQIIYVFVYDLFVTCIIILNTLSFGVLGHALAYGYDVANASLWT